MKCHEKAKPGAVCRDKKVLEPATSDLRVAGDGLLRSANDLQSNTDYSEEAIPERDPAYQLSKGTVYETQTIEQVSPAERLALARCLEELGMSRERAMMVASL